MEVDEVPTKEEEDGERRGILLSGADDEEEPEEEEEEDAAATTNGRSAASAAASAAAAAATADHPYGLIGAIITPSPFDHHNSSDRYRSALARVQSSPLTDVEAWGAILTEASTSYRSLVPHLHYLGGGSLAAGVVPPPGVGSPSELEAKLDWVESCHGALLRHFPYAAAYAVSMAEILMGQTSLQGEEGAVQAGAGESGGGVLPPHDGMRTERQRRLEGKLEGIFKVGLGLSTAEEDEDEDEGAEKKEGNDGDGDGDGGGGGEQAPSSAPSELLGGMFSPSAELWLLYVRCVTRRATRAANVLYPHFAADPGQRAARAEQIRAKTAAAFESALSLGGAYCLNNHLVWSAYLTFVKSWEGEATTAATDGTVSTDHALLQRRLALLRRLYQRLVGNPMTGLDSYWAEYEAFERGQGGTGADQLASALVAEHEPRYRHARTVYLERNRVCDLRNASTSLGVGRLACPPVEPPGLGGGGTGSATEGGAGGDSGPNGGPGGAGADGDSDQAQYEEKLEEELTLLSRWTTRVSYERTNPERVSSADLTKRVRATYKEYAACFQRHPEVWDSWSAWEFLHSTSSSDSGAGGGAVKLTGKIMRKRAAMAEAVLCLGANNVPDCALLVLQRASVLERYGGRAGEGGGEAAIHLLSEYALTNPSTLIFVSLQKLVRKHVGVVAARAVFSKARRKLRVRAEDCVDGSSTERQSSVIVADDADGNKGSDEAVGSGKSGKAGVKEGRGGGRMVTTRLAPSIAAGAVPKAAKDAATTAKGGIITHHLYSSHADIERYLNTSPHVAARVYELGLRRHRTFLTVPAYVLGYANLLLELGDWSNLRGLLARSVGACEEETARAGSESDGDNDASTRARREASRPLWDAYLKIEALISCASGGGDADPVQAVEARRRKALYGPTSRSNGADGSGEDVVCGAFGAVEGSQHSNVADTLIRSDGYDSSSMIANGLGRLVDSLQVCGLVGGGSAASGGAGGDGLAVSASISLATKVAADDNVGGAADAGLRRRLSYVRKKEAMETLVNLTGGTVVGTVGARIAAGGAAGRVRERILQQQQQQQALVQASAATPISPASPEWLIPLIALLPKLALHRAGARPPPHLIEMALASLQTNSMPAERPEDAPHVAANGLSDPANVASVASAPPSDPRKRRAPVGGDESSDEDNAGKSGGGGYGQQFRQRRRVG